MPDAAPSPDPTLHLPSLVIKNFRGIDELTIPRLGRVTLLTGKNGVGKSSVLDAVSIYSSRGNRFIISGTLDYSDEVVSLQDERGRVTTVANWLGLFTGRENAPMDPVSIGTAHEPDSFTMRLVDLDANEQGSLVIRRNRLLNNEETLALQVTACGVSRNLLPHGVSINPIKSRPADRSAYPSEILCNLLTPDVPDNESIEGFLDSVALTPAEDTAVDALGLMMAPQVERVALVDAGERGTTRAGRRVLAKVKGHNKPVPLRSLGDGVVRVFTVALALANSSGGFLLIDEAENGIHHSIQAKFWKMVLQTAERNNVQVLATTHSWDCVKGFAEASAELEDVDGILVRLERHEDRLRAVEYSERNLKAAAKYGIEVR